MSEIDMAKKLWTYIGEIDDAILEEAELADIAANVAARKRCVKYGTVAAAATFGIAAATYFLLRSRRATASA
jgi:hypothetical protein